MTPAGPLPLGTIAPRVRRLTGVVDPLELYRALTGGGLEPDTFLLESADRTSHSGERSLIGIRSALYLAADRETVRIEPRSPNGDAAVDWLAPGFPAATRDGPALVIPVAAPSRLVATERDRFRRPSPFDVLRKIAFGVELSSMPNPWCHLLVGGIGYDAIDFFEPLPRGRPEPLAQPLLEFWVPDQLVVIDHVRHATTVATMAWGGDRAASRWHDANQALEVLVASIQALANAPVSASFFPLKSGDHADADTDQTDLDYQATVARLQRHIAAGDIYQVVPSRTFTLPCRDPIGAYRELRRRNPSPYLFYLAGPKRVLFGASPETCLRIDGPTRRATILPIAGTAPRGRGSDGLIDPDLDIRNEVTLRLDPKELAEHLMLVDLARNDIARISIPGTREVSRLLAVERYSHVMHLVSEVTGTLAPDIDALEAFATTMPMGTLVGAPKVKAAELLREHETGRGMYGGGVGYLRHDGTLETAIVIRSAVVANGMASVRAGAGVVLDSDPAKEAEETRRKARAVVAAISATEGAGCA